MGKRLQPRTYFCYRCRWRWLPRKPETPKVCPRCHSTRWQKVDSVAEERVSIVMNRTSNAAFDMEHVLIAMTHNDAAQWQPWAVRRARAILSYIDTGRPLKHVKPPWIKKEKPASRDIPTFVIAKNTKDYERWRAAHPAWWPGASEITADQLRALRGPDVRIVRTSEVYGRRDYREIEQYLTALLGEGAEIRYEDIPSHHGP